ncbi:MAG TPA: hypothetical protein VEZ12_21605, partial [Herpetosiphonaceae bacterium]|nr:hypothetical protein [Herpetosiphonaceae bacterium]
AAGLPIELVDCTIAALRNGLALHTVLETARISHAQAGVITRAIGWTRTHKDDLLEHFTQIDRRRQRRQARQHLEEDVQ